MKRYITLEDFIAFSRGKSKIQLAPKEKDQIRKSREAIESQMEGQVIYGFNTGVGPFFKEKITPETQVEFQRGLILIHAAGVGPCLDEKRARGVMFLLINMLRRGYSGISLETLQLLIDLFNKDIIPAIPEQGSVGASGDLAPLAHIAAVLLGEGFVLRDGNSIPTKFVFEFEKGQIRPIELRPGEAIALINGTHFMTSILAWLVWQAEILSKIADIAAALSIYSLGGNPGAFDEKLHKLRPHHGSSQTSKTLKAILGKDYFNDGFLQDAYSLRCVPQIHGACKAAISFARKAVKDEINSVTGNPIFADAGIIHGGNFHGQPLSQAADFLSIGLATLGNISERRIERLLNPNLSGLPAFLSKKPGLDSGLMIAQYTAASLVSENKTLAHPASIDSIPLAGGQEDFVSMGAWACRKAWQICKNTAYVLAIELICAFRALEFKQPFPGSPIEKIQEVIKQNILSQENPHILADEIEMMQKFIWSGEFLDGVKNILKKPS